MTNNTNTRIIHTGLYTDLASHVINHGVIGQLSDGWGENNPKNAKYWKFISIKRAENDEVLLEVSGGYDSYDNVESAFNYKSDCEVCEWVANTLKKTVKMEMTDNPSLGKWDRWNSHDGCYFDAKVCEAYLIYEILKGRSRSKDKYSLSTKENVVGTPITPEIRAKRAAIAKIKADTEAEIERIKSEAERSIAEIQAA